jgi:Golgi phosphoprotein 3
LLTVAEEYLLLTAGGPDETTTAPVVDLPDDRPGIRFAMTGAALMELAIRDRIDTDVDHLWVCDSSPTGEQSIDPVLARLLELANRNGAKSPIKSPIVDTVKELDSINSYQLALDSLRSRGLVSEQIERGFWVFRIKSLVATDVDVVRGIRKRINDVLFTGEIPDPRDACLISILDATKKFRRVVAPERVQEAIEQTRRYSSLDLVGRSVAIHVTGMINSFSKYGDIV